ncbi:hypothetical protein EGR_01224 [Echinococcus granulosus]|uniref:Uncharacterized protein n=1 Tax=Echinococcus granulosus TaxID=6210 RepID=W6UTV7_ECHGR|nr:hypothetical protein EGR_01224 [Echinococcus granulosus]EUB64096.1 hypothetical protein EGR_01224 [Echinococcus granulosus]
MGRQQIRLEMLHPKRWCPSNNSFPEKRSTDSMIVARIQATPRCLKFTCCPNLFITEKKTKNSYISCLYSVKQTIYTNWRCGTNFTLQAFPYSTSPMLGYLVQNRCPPDSPLVNVLQAFPLSSEEKSKE